LATEVTRRKFEILSPGTRDEDTDDFRSLVLEAAAVPFVEWLASTLLADSLAFAMSEVFETRWDKVED
jgi:hypothetical protein